VDCVRAVARAVATALFVALLALPPAASAIGAHDGAGLDFDSRGDNRLPAFSKPERGAQAHLRGKVAAGTLGGRVGANRSGVSITGLADQLTGARGGDPERIARSYLSGNAGALGLLPSDVGALKLEDSYRSWEGTTHLTWTQSAGGIDAYDSRVGANVAGDGSVINVWSTALPDFQGDGKPALSAAEALGVASRAVDAAGAAPRARQASGKEAATKFSNGATAALTLFGTPGGTKLAWKVGLAGQRPETYEVVVDAGKGDVLALEGKTHSANAQVFERFPGAPAGGAATTVDLAPYLSDATGASGLSGPNARAWSDTTDDCFVVTLTSVSPGCAGPGAGEGVAVSGGADFSFPVSSFPSPAGQSCPPASPFCTWDSAAADSWQTNRQQNAVQVFYYANKFHDHLQAAPIGFDSASRNFEGSDAVVVNTDDGASGPGGLPPSDHQNNAFFATPQDGVPPVLGTDLFGQPGFRSVNGGDDAVIVYHEYTHGLSNRLIGNGSGLSSHQSDSMAEGWSDWYALDYEVSQGFITDAATPGDLDTDSYVTPPGARLIRTEAMDCPVGSADPACPGTTRAGKGGYTFGDIGRILRGPQVHADGEVWGQTLWDIRAALGSPTTERLVTDAMRNSPLDPSFLDQRDQILAADVAAFGGANRDTLWRIFAARGMGARASTPSADSIAVTESFELPAP
jgi:hypothetical protein